MATDEDITKIDIYQLLEIPVESNEISIRSAYHRKALKCHPDKNPDNPERAAKEFRKLSRALEILLDSNARADYNKILKARRYHESKYKELDSKRQKLRDDLDINERRYFGGQERDIELEAQIKLQQHIARIRREGSKLLEEENLKVERQVRKERKNIPHRHGSGTTNVPLNDEDYEKLVLTRLRQAQQLKTLSLNDK